MILVDTSVWIDHLRAGNKTLATQLDNAQILAHPFVIGELALGNLRQPERIINYLQDLPQAVVATEREVLYFIRQQHLAGSGIGYVDAHLLAATQLSPDTRLWTLDRRLAAVATRLGLRIRFPD